MPRTTSRIARSLALPLFALALVGNDLTDRAEQLMGDGKEAEAFALIEEGAEEGDAEAINYLAWFYDQGRFVEQDTKRAAELYRKAATLDVAYAQWRLGVMIDEGVTRGTPEEALALFKRAAAQEFTNAMVSLAVMHAIGRGTESDPAAARFYYSMAAAAGNSHAIRGLGILFLHGEGVEADREEAAAYFLLAASYDNEEARQALIETSKSFDRTTQQKVRRRAQEIAEGLGFVMGDADVGDFNRKPIGNDRP